MISELYRLLQKRRGKLVALALKNDQVAQTNKVLAEHGIEQVIYFSGDCGKSAYKIAANVADLSKREKPAAIFAAGTIWGHDLAALVAAKLRVPLFPNFVEIGFDEQNRLVVYRTILNNTIDAKIIAREKVLVATTQLEQFNIKKAKLPKVPNIVEITKDLSPLEEPTRIITKIKADPKTVDIVNADILIVGGGGMGSRDNFQLIHEVADLLGGSVAGTRVARDKGWITLDRQIGQTGKKVSPKLLISCGVSGAMQLTMGLKGTRNLIAINIDKNAPIFQLADLKIVGDAPTILTDFINKAKALAKNRKEIDKQPDQ